MSYQFYIGLDDVYYAHRFSHAFISVNRLRERRSHFAVNNWIMDSGAFTEICTHGTYRDHPAVYAEQIEIWRHCGGFECAVAQDWMCEPMMIEKTGLSVREHQELTVSRYDRLIAETDAPIMPVLQGWTPRDYLTHIADYGEMLKPGMRVGVGSVCKRNNHPAVIEYILGQIKSVRPDLKLHGFGLKLTALHRPEIRRMLFSSDSMAWSLNARKNGRNAHDWREAKAYENRVMNPPKCELFQ